MGNEPCWDNDIDSEASLPSGDDVTPFPQALLNEPSIQGRRLRGAISSVKQPGSGAGGRPYRRSRPQVPVNGTDHRSQRRPAGRSPSRLPGGIPKGGIVNVLLGKGPAISNVLLSPVVTDLLQVRIRVKDRLRRRTAIKNHYQDT